MFNEQTKNKIIQLNADFQCDECHKFTWTAASKIKAGLSDSKKLKSKLK